MTISQSTAQYINVVLGTWLWGFYALLFGATMYLNGTRRVGVNIAYLSIIALFLLNSLGTGIELYTNYQPFTYHVDYITLGVVWRNSVPSAVGPILNLTLSIRIWIADAVMTWRLFVIWSRNYRVILLPLVILALGAPGGLCIMVFDIIDLVDKHLEIYAAVSTTLFCATALLNLYVTSLIVGRLWWTGHLASKLGGNTTTGNRYARIMTALTEGGILYTIGSILFIVFLFLSNNDLLVYQNVFGSITCITPTIIYLRLAVGMAQPADVKYGVNPTSDNPPVFIQRRQPVRRSLSITTTMSTVQDTEPLRRLGDEAIPSAVMVQTETQTV